MDKKEEIYKLIKDNESLIYKLAYKNSRYYNIDDLYQVGTIGLIKAYNNYKDEMNSKFSSYAYKYILGEMINFIKKDRNITISDEVYSVYKKYVKIKDLLFSKYEREVTLCEIAKFMQIGEDELLKVIESVAFTKSIDENENVNYGFVDDDFMQKIVIDQELEALDIFDRTLIDYRYYQGFTQCETANLMGISQVKVSRQEKLILSKMRNNLTI